MKISLATYLWTRKSILVVFWKSSASDPDIRQGKESAGILRAIKQLVNQLRPSLSHESNKKGEKRKTKEKPINN